MSSCAVPGCHIHYPKSGQPRRFSSEIKLHPLPKDPKRAAAWKKLIPRVWGGVDSDGNVIREPKHIRVCSLHFVGGKKSDDPASPSYQPSIFPNKTPKTPRNTLNSTKSPVIVPTHLTPKTTGLKRKHPGSCDTASTPTSKRCKTAISLLNKMPAVDNKSSVCEIPIRSVLGSIENRNTPQKRPYPNQVLFKTPESFPSTSKDSSDSSPMFTPNRMIFKTPEPVLSHCKNDNVQLPVASSSKSDTNARDSLPVPHQTDHTYGNAPRPMTYNEMSEKIKELEKDNTYLKLQNEMLKKRVISVDMILMDKECYEWTGICSYATFESLLRLIMNTVWKSTQR